MLIKIIITSIVALFITAQVHASSWELINPNIALQCSVDPSSSNFITKKDDKTINWITKKTSKHGFNNTWCYQKPDKLYSYPPGSIVKFNGLGYNYWGWN